MHGGEAAAGRDARAGGDGLGRERVDTPAGRDPRDTLSASGWPTSTRAIAARQPDRLHVLLAGRGSLGTRRLRRDGRRPTADRRGTTEKMYERPTAEGR